MTRHEQRSMKHTTEECDKHIMRMRESYHTDVSLLYEEALAAHTDFVMFPHEGETLKLLKIAAEQAELRLLQEEGPESISRLYRETELRLEMLELIKKGLIKPPKT